ncbi:MAG TPA: hypothetical protein VJ748_02005 [Vitreimonas sp.]|nr:hypothetical protein [Vitreimonas sp.]
MVALVFGNQLRRRERRIGRLEARDLGGDNLAVRVALDGCDLAEHRAAIAADFDPDGGIPELLG